MKQREIDATPEKRIFLSIISEYDLKRSICELIDNAIDLWSKTRRKGLLIEILADFQQRTLTIIDNAGGIHEDNLDNIITPGRTSNDISDDVIGYFGVGSKRAVIALAENIQIHSRYKGDKAFTIKIDDEWININPDWTLPYRESSKPIPPSSTIIELSKLRMELNETEIAELESHLSEVYSFFIEKGVTIKVNGRPQETHSFERDWAYPPDFSPAHFSASMLVDNRKVYVEIISGLLNHPGYPDDSYGVFIYCNGRLIVRGFKEYSVGFSSGMVGNPHYNISLVRTIVKLRGASRDMPWDSSKSGLNLKHPTYIAIRHSIIDLTKRYAQISRSLQGKWDQDVFPHKSGKMTSETLESIATIPKSYLPTPPPSRIKWHQKITMVNAKVIKEKPWSGGLLDGVLAVDIISKQTFSQKNRIAFIVLDSTLEIAYKEYLLNEMGMGLSAFKKVVENRADIEKLVQQNLNLDNSTIKKINFYYKLRNDLVHLRATPNIVDSQVEDYKNLVESLLAKMFGLAF